MRIEHDSSTKTLDDDVGDYCKTTIKTRLLMMMVAAAGSLMTRSITIIDQELLDEDGDGALSAEDRFHRDC